jgi:hypothetical protein
VARRVVHAIHTDRRRLIMPWLVHLVPVMRFLPVGAFDWVVNFLGVNASMTIHNTLRTLDSQNVMGKIEGADPAHRDEYVVYTADWDHLGKSAEGIFHGAVDNASGTGAILEIARAMLKTSPPPQRSILFVSVTAEEQGLLGSQYYAVTPVYPLAKTLANINLDGINVHGRTKDITLIGYGASDLDDYTRTAAADRTAPSAGCRAGKRAATTVGSFQLREAGHPALDPDEAWIRRQAGGYGQKVRDVHQQPVSLAQGRHHA